MPPPSTRTSPPSSPAPLPARRRPSTHYKCAAGLHHQSTRPDSSMASPAAVRSPSRKPCSLPFTRGLAAALAPLSLPTPLVRPCSPGASYYIASTDDTAAGLLPYCQLHSRSRIARCTLLVPWCLLESTPGLGHLGIFSVSYSLRLYVNFFLFLIIMATIFKYRTSGIGSIRIHSEKYTNLMVLTGS